MKANEISEKERTIERALKHYAMRLLDLFQNPEIHATFYDSSDSILGSDHTFTEPTTLEPGQSAPFELTAGFGDNLPVDEIASIKYI